MTHQQVHYIQIGSEKYCLTAFEDRIGVARGFVGKFKYMPVVFKLNSHYYFPQLLKTRLAMTGTAEDLVNNILTCIQVNSNLLEAYTALEHILHNGRTPR